MSVLHPYVVHSGNFRPWGCGERADVPEFLKALASWDDGEQGALRLMQRQGRARILSQWALCYVVNHTDGACCISVVSGPDADKQFWTTERYLKPSTDHSTMECRARNVRKETAFNEPTIMKADEFSKMRAFLDVC